MATDKILKIDTCVPYGDSIYSWLHLIPESQVHTLIEDSHQADKHYLAWETVRKGRNPFFENGTGFEGYFVGSCASTDAVFAQILGVANGMLNSIARLYRYDYTFRSKLEKTLIGEAMDPKAMNEWSAQFGAAIARLRCNVYRNHQADQFHSETYRLVSWLPPIDYKQDDHEIRQLYVIDLPDSTYNKTIINAHALPAAEQEAWMVAQAIGKFGHPLVREFVRFSPS